MLRKRKTDSSQPSPVKSIRKMKPKRVTAKVTVPAPEEGSPEGGLPEGGLEDGVIMLRGPEAVWEALETVAKMPYPGVGLRTIAGILRGETRANWLSYIARTESWGAFFPNPLPTVEAFLRELIRAGYLEGTHFTRLTEQGQRVLEQKEPPTVRRRLKLVVKEARPLLWKLLLLRARLVNERKAPGLLKDTVLLQLLKTRPTNVDALKHIKGVGAFITQQLGERIVEVIRSFAEQDHPNK